MFTKKSGTFKHQVRDMKKIFREPVLTFTIIVTIVFLAIFIVYPLFSILKVSVISESGFSLNAYMKAVKSTSFMAAFKNTMALGISVGFLSTVIGFIFAYALVYLKSPFKGLLKFISILPMVSPPFVLALSAIILFGQFGLVTRHLLGITDFNIYGFKGVLLVQTMTFFPVSFLMMEGSLRKIDPSLEEASQNMGANKFKTFLKVVLPLMAPAIANSFLITFIEVIADFSNPMVIGGNLSTLATSIYMQSIGNYDIQGGSAMSVILLVLSLTLFGIEKLWLEKRSYITVTGKSAKERHPITDNRVVIPVNVFCLIISIVVIGFYSLIPLGGLFKLIGVDYSLTLDHFKHVFVKGFKPVWDTTKLALIATPITGLFGMIVSFIITRKKFIGRGFIEFTSLLAMAVPGTVLGLGYVNAFNTRPFLLTGTATLIIIAFIVRNLPVSIRNGVSSLEQIDPAIEEAAQDMGASSVKVFSSVTLPLISSAFFSGLIYTFVKSMTAVSTVIFLVTPRHQMLTSSIMSQVDNGRFGIACAYSTVLIVIVFFAVTIMNMMMKIFGLSSEVKSK